VTIGRGASVRRGASFASYGTHRGSRVPSPRCLRLIRTSIQSACGGSGALPEVTFVPSLAANLGRIFGSRIFFAAGTFSRRQPRSDLSDLCPEAPGRSPGSPSCRRSPPTSVGSCQRRSDLVWDLCRRPPDDHGVRRLRALLLGRVTETLEVHAVAANTQAVTPRAAGVDECVGGVDALIAAVAPVEGALVSVVALREMLIGVAGVV